MENSCLRLGDVAGLPGMLWKAPNPRLIGRPYWRNRGHRINSIFMKVSVTGFQSFEAEERDIQVIFGRFGADVSIPRMPSFQPQPLWIGAF